jgi:cell division protease FtsH
LIVVVKTSQGLKEQTLSFTEFQDKVKNKEVHSVVITGNEVHGLFQNPALGLHTYIPANYPDIYNLLRDNNVDMTIKDNSSGTWISMLINFSPFIVLFAFWIFMMRQMQSGGNKALSFGKSRARLHSTQQKKGHLQGCGGGRRG